MKTEEEARQCWCPFARVLSIAMAGDDLMDGGPFNRVSAVRDGVQEPSGVHPQSACIASECMAWRWDHFVARHAEHGPNHQGESGPAKGRCGLAGKS